MANIPISSFTAAANATGIGMSGFSLTGANAQSMLDLAGTWNTSGTPSAISLNVTDTASNAASLLMNLRVGGTSQFSVAKNGNVTINPTGTAGPYSIQLGDTAGRLEAYGSAFGVQPLYCSYAGGFAINNNTGTLRLGSASDTILARDAANTFAQRNGVNAQTFRVYNTFTDASNYERGFVRWSANALQIGNESAGTGVARGVVLLSADHLDLQSAAARSIRFAPGGTAVCWLFNASGHFIAATDNAFDIGASGANRPRNLFLGGLVNFGGASVGATGNTVTLTNNGNSQILTIGIATNTLMIGGITSSFPALKRNGTALETKLADDSAYAPHSMQYTEITDGITAPGAAAGRARIYVDTADGDLKVVFADGTVKTIVTDT